jgi:hypothetical protein
MAITSSATPEAIRPTLLAFIMVAILAQEARRLCTAQNRKNIPVARRTVM